jgi:hypothetical protein
MNCKISGLVLFLGLFCCVCESAGVHLDLAVKKGCRGVKPDNADGYVGKTGLPLSYQGQLNDNLWLSE